MLSTYALVTDLNHNVEFCRVKEIRALSDSPFFGLRVLKDGSSTWMTAQAIQYLTVARAWQEHMENNREDEMYKDIASHSTRIDNESMSLKINFVLKDGHSFEVDVCQTGEQFSIPVLNAVFLDRLFKHKKAAERVKRAQEACKEWNVTLVEHPDGKHYSIHYNGGVVHNIQTTREEVLSADFYEVAVRIVSKDISDRAAKLREVVNNLK